MGIWFVLAGADRLPSVVAASSLAAVANFSMDAVRGVSRSFGDLW